MDTFDLFDPRYQLEAEEPAPAPRVHEEIQLTLLSLERLAGQLRERVGEPEASRGRHRSG